jgi:Domain of unknown function (DUF4279)
VPFEGEDDPACKFACAMLLVSGENIEIDEFTRLLGLTPSETGVAGVCNGWKLSSALHVLSTNVERHIHWILDQIEGKQGVIQYLKREKKCQVDLGCVWQGHRQSNDDGPFLTPVTLRRVADLNLNMIFYVRH